VIEDIRNRWLRISWYKIHFT